MNRTEKILKALKQRALLDSLVATSELSKLEVDVERIKELIDFDEVLDDWLTQLETDR